MLWAHGHGAHGDLLVLFVPRVDDSGKSPVPLTELKLSPCSSTKPRGPEPDPYRDGKTKPPFSERT